MVRYLVLDLGDQMARDRNIEAVASSAPQNRTSDGIEFGRFMLRNVFLHRTAHVFRDGTDRSDHRFRINLGLFLLGHGARFPNAVLDLLPRGWVGRHLAGGLP